MNNQTHSSATEISYQLAGVVRRIGAMIYDAMLVMAVLAVAIIPFVVCTHMFIPGKVLIPSDVGWLIYGMYLGWQLLVIVLFFGFFWTRRGQTLGMQVWHLRVEDEQGQLLSWPMTLKRMLFAAVFWLPGFICIALSEQLQSRYLKWTGEALLLLGLMNLLMAKFSSRRRTWHDQMASSRVVIKNN